eukprot:2914067-Pyramimonas_sp.AAC.1
MIKGSYATLPIVTMCPFLLGLFALVLTLTLLRVRMMCFAKRQPPAREIYDETFGSGENVRVIASCCVRVSAVLG